MKLNYKKLKEFDNHKLVVSIKDKATGLKGFVAIHNSSLGIPAVGGTRMMPYHSEKEALVDVLKLSRAMTYKCAMASVPYGGGKAVIIGNPKKQKTKKLLTAYAQKINTLKGQFYTGEDMGITQRNVIDMLKTSKYFIGKPKYAGDPSPYAALSVFYAMQGAVKYVQGKKSLEESKVAIRGVGKVGKALVKLLSRERANIFVSDTDPAALKFIKRKFPKVHVVSNRIIQTLPVDIYSPCAVGDEFSFKRSKGKIGAKIICGAANNQLADEKIGDWLFKNNIIYIPDYVANAGGLIDVVDELGKDGYKKKRVLRKIKEIQETVQCILSLSSKAHLSPHRVADQIAEQSFQKIK